jgi:nitrogen fixation protein NifB
LQDICSGDMNMMRHCRQCRADAVGLLGEDRGAEFALDKVEGLEVDYRAAMQRRAEVHAGIEAARAAKAAAPKPEGVAVVRLDALVSRKAGRPVLVAVASKGGGLINQHFGHAREFLVYEASPAGVRFIGHRRTDAYCSGDETCGEGEDALARTLRALEGCAAVLCAKIGFGPWGRLEAAGIQPNGEHAMEPIEEAVLAVYRELAAAPAAPTAQAAG